MDPMGNLDSTMDEFQIQTFWTPGILELISFVGVVILQLFTYVNGWFFMFFL